MRFIFTLALLTFLCTCGRAQNGTDKLPRDISSIAFIKGKTGFLIDSLTIRTSLDTLPYGFAFPGDTLLFDVSVFRPVDQLTVETFAQGHSFKRYSCWIDAPSADVYLSIAAGRTIIDSVGLSPMDRWFREEAVKIQLSENLEYVKTSLKRSIVDSRSLLMCATFIKTFQRLPNLTRGEIIWLKTVFRADIGAVKRHPWFTPILARQKLLQSNLPGKLEKYELSDQLGNPIEVTTPKSQYYVLNFYDARKTESRRDHHYLREVISTDSIFASVPLISISRGDYVDGWQNYVRENDFSWPHYLESPSPSKQGIYNKMALFPASTYVLLNEKNQIEGVFEDPKRLTTAVLLRKQTSK